MGVNCRGDIAARLLDAGIDPARPVTIVENGTLDNERVFATTIGDLWETSRARASTARPSSMSASPRRKASADIVTFPVRESRCERRSI